MNIRTNQKTRLKSILESISYNSATLPVFIGVKTQTTAYPYVFIVSGDLIPNKTGETLSDRGTYDRVRSYFVNLVFMNDGTIESINDAEVQVDQLEQLILDKIGDEATRNDGDEWFDIYCTDVSSPFNGAEISLEGNTIVKTFIIALETQEVYD